MTAEACRDVIPKAQVQVAHSGNEALERLKEESFDFMIIDFDLPDCDGVSFIREVKKSFPIPMFLTAFPDSVVLNAIETELFWYEDASRLIPKPVEMKELKNVITSFVFEEKRLIKEFKPELVASLSREKSRSQGIDTEVLRMNLEGVSLKYAKQTLFSKNEKVLMRLSPYEKRTKRVLGRSFLVRGTVFYVDLKAKKLDLVFEDLSSPVQKKLENILRSSQVF